MSSDRHEDGVSSRIVRGAVVQASPVWFDSNATVAKVADLAADAARRGAELIVFPEAFVGSYPKGLDFGTVVGMRSTEGRDQFRRYFENAITIPGPEVTALGSIARGHAVHLVIGVIERAGGTLYCTSLLFGPDGSVLGLHRKIMPTAMERILWGSGDGSTLPVVATPLGRVGTVICWENYMPLLRTAMYARGVEFYCAITVDDRETWPASMRHIAFEGRCFVLSACQYLTRSDLPTDAPVGSVAADRSTLIRGGSTIVGPLGEVLAGPLWDEEGILLADLNRADLARARFDFDAVGHYARPDIFHLTVDDRPRPSVTFRSEDGTDLSKPPGH